MDYESIAGLIELGFVYAVALGIGIWQVIKMRRAVKLDREAATRQADAKSPTE